MHFTLGKIFVLYAVNSEADEATSLLASLTKAKDPPRSCTSAGRPTLACLVAISGFRGKIAFFTLQIILTNHGNVAPVGEVMSFDDDALS